MTSDLHDYGAPGVEGDVREIASRLKAVGEVLIGRDVTVGPRSPDSTVRRWRVGVLRPPGVPRPPVRPIVE